MELFNAALPNVMFLVGIAAICIGLGIELKIVPVANQVSRGGRIGAMGLGAALVVASIAIYLSPGPAVGGPAAAASAAATAAPPTATAQAPTVAAAALVAKAPTAAPPTATAEPPTAEPPTATAAPPTATAEPPTATAAPPTAEPPTATAAPPTATAIPMATVPDIRTLDQKGAEQLLKAVGLRLGSKREDCQAIGQAGEGERKAERNRVRCQSPAADSAVPLGTAIDFVLAGKKDE